MRSVIFLLFYVVSMSAFSCSCAVREGSTEELVKLSLDEASSVVLATVEGIEQKDYGMPEGPIAPGSNFGRIDLTHFSEVKSWKGDHAKHFYTRIEVSCCMCGYVFEVGKTYLLYLHGPDNEGYYVTGICSRTAHESDALDDIKVLDSAVPNKALQADSLL